MGCELVGAKLKKKKLKKPAVTTFKLDACAEGESTPDQPCYKLGKQQFWRMNVDPKGYYGLE